MEGARYAAVDSLGYCINAVMWDGVQEFEHPFDTTLIQTDFGCRGDLWDGANFSRFTDAAWRSTEGRALVRPCHQAKTGVLITLGQSNICCLAQGTYTPLNAGIYNFNIYDGQVYVAANPLIGVLHSLPSWANGPNIPIADGLITAGIFDQVILVTLGFYHSTRNDEAAELLLSKGWKPDAILWHHGEAATAAGMSHDAYKNIIQTNCARFRHKGIIAPFFVAQQSRQTVGGQSVTSETVRSAQRDSVSADLNIVLGADWDAAIPPDVSYRYDAVHFTALGSLTAAQADVAMLTNYFKQARGA